MKKLILSSIIFLAFASSGTAKDIPSKDSAPRGVKPLDEWNCPETHPIKGNINPQKHTMIYHMPGGQYYYKTMPERCYATEEDAKADGFRKSRR